MFPSEIIEYASWSYLEEHDDPELVLLKGHLLLEVVLDAAVASFAPGQCKGFSDLSFHRKLERLTVLRTDAEPRFLRAMELLIHLNRLRNRLAHQLMFQGGQHDLSEWSENVLKEFPPTKHSKYTFRTKIVHAFATLARVIHESFERPDARPDLGPGASIGRG
jgi:hypothetical protein